MSTLSHLILTERLAIKDALRLINDKINGCGFSFREATKDNDRLSFENENPSEKQMIIESSFDFCYYHDLELVFYDVGFTDIGHEDYWWDHWDKDQIELSDETFLDGFEFRFNPGPHKEYQYVVRAKRFSYLFEQVNYYNH